MFDKSGRWRVAALLEPWGIAFLEGVINHVRCSRAVQCDIHLKLSTWQLRVYRASSVTPWEWKTIACSGVRRMG